MAIDGAEYLVDNSAYNRLSYPTVRRKLEPLVTAGLVATCAALDLEALYSSRDPDDYEHQWDVRASVFRYVETDEQDWQAALAVQRELARRSQHRGPRIPDLIIAAVASRHDLMLIHFDSDFDRIVEVTGQRAEWVVPRGSVG